MVEAQLVSGWATYLRVSDEDKQTPERSFAMQRQRIQEQLLSPSDLPFTREYRDVLTGTSPNRADYQQMLADAEGGRFSHLGLYRADRFGRDTIEGLQAATRLIGLGVRIRVADMPGLQPETPDGFFVFLLQMGLAQREVDVLRQRTEDGMAAKLRAGGWAQKAPEGYVNKEELISSGKYRRWVEPDPIQKRCLREAWNLLLTGRYTLAEICEKLTERGYTRSGKRPWAWTDPKTGRRCNARNRLHGIFHNPFYAGWVVSEQFGIPFGEVRGQWEPIVTIDEYERGIEVLRRSNVDKSRAGRHLYLLRKLLWVAVDGHCYRMYGSTPTGRSRSYSYYLTHTKPQGQKVRIPCKAIDEQIPGWIRRITIDPELLPAVRDAYCAHIQQTTAVDRESRLATLQRRLAQLRQEEMRLGRLFITGKMNEATYDQLRAEWQEKVRHAEANLADLERKTSQYLDDLDVALLLLAEAHRLFERLEPKQRSLFLQILAKRIIVSVDGEIIDHELHSPFAYLIALVGGTQITDPNKHGSEQVLLGSLLEPPALS